MKYIVILYTCQRQNKVWNHSDTVLLPGSRQQQDKAISAEVNGKSLMTVRHYDVIVITVPVLALIYRQLPQSLEKAG